MTSWLKRPGVRPAWTFAGLLVAYYTFHVDFAASPGVLVLSFVAMICGLGILGWMMVMELDRLRHGQSTRSTVALAMLLGLLVMAFSAVRCRRTSIDASIRRLS